MARALACLVCLLALARADSSLPPGADDLARCTMNDAPFRKLTSDVRFKPEPNMWLRHAGGRWLLYANSSFEKPARSVLVDTSGKLPPMILAGQRDTQLVLDERGELRGILALSESERNLRRVQLYSPKGALLWESSPTALWGDSAATLVAGELLVIGVFHRIATGSALLALDLATGKQRWRADVEQLNVGHSKYYNDVSLERRGETVVMRGFEAAGCYRQVFELATGARLAAQMPARLWR